MEDSHLGEAAQILRSGSGDRPRESRDGKSVYYTQGYPAPFSVWRAPTDGGDRTKILDSALDWTVGTEGIYFTIEDKQGRTNICLQEFATARIRMIARTERPTSLGMALSPDEKTPLYTQLDESGSDLMLVENFR